MSFLRGTKKLLVAAGLASCGAAAAVIISGFHSDFDRFKTRAASLIHHPWIEHQNAIIAPPPKWDYNWDKREPNSLANQLKGSFKINETDENKINERLEKVKSRATRHLILVRHGQYNLNGETDQLRSLTSLGREQANYAGLRLKELQIPYKRIVQSTMTRATETASIISKHLPNVPVDSCDFLREGHPAVPEPSSWTYQPKIFQDGARIEAAFRKYFHRADPSQTKDSHEILVCHANVIRYFICRALQFPPEAWLRFSLHNCSLTWIAIRPSGTVTVYTVGDFGHIPASKKTTS